jgi:hypothetical protein
MDLEQLQNESERDLNMDDALLDIESLKTPQLYNKYLKHYTKFNLLLKKAESEYKVTLRNKWEYYSGKSDPSVYKAKPFDLKILKQDLHMYIESDEDIIKLSQKIEYLKTVLDTLDKILKMISNRGFQIKNAIDWRKFLDGANI